jgi:hypothetical protein
VGRSGLHSERATRRHSSKEQKESAQKKGAPQARTHSRIKVSCDPGEIDLGIAQGGPQHHPERCEYLDNFAIRHTASHLWPVMRRHLTGYIAFCAISPVRSILQVSAPGPKNHTHHISIAGKNLVLHNGVPNKVVLLKFHTPFLWLDTSRRNEGNRRPLSNCRNTLAKKISSGTIMCLCAF